MSALMWVFRSCVICYFCVTHTPICNDQTSKSWTRFIFRSIHFKCIVSKILQRGKWGYLPSDELVFQDGVIIICSMTWEKDSPFLSLKRTLQNMLAGNLLSKSLRKAKKNTKTFWMTSEYNSMYVYMCRKQPSLLVISEAGKASVPLMDSRR